MRDKGCMCGGGVCACVCACAFVCIHVVVYVCDGGWGSDLLFV